MCLTKGISLLLFRESRSCKCRISSWNLPAAGSTRAGGPSRKIRSICRTLLPSSQCCYDISKDCYILPTTDFKTLTFMWISETELETEPTEPGPLGKKAGEKEWQMITCLLWEQKWSCYVFDLQIAERSNIPAPDSTLFTSHASSAWTASASTGM